MSPLVVNGPSRWQIAGPNVSPVDSSVSGMAQSASAQ
jgi:hypothetical protein